MSPESTSLATAGRSRYSMLAQTLLEGINAGRYPVGSLLPTELELCRQFGISRTTVREAIRSLRDMGLVSAKPGVGTFVRARRESPRYVHAVESISDIFQYATQANSPFQYSRHSERPIVLNSEEIEVGDEEAELLGSGTGQRWLRIDTMRHFVGDDEPIVYSHSYLPITYRAIPALVPKHREPMYTLIESEYGERVSDVVQEFTATRLDRSQANILRVKTGSAGLCVIRHYYAEGERLLLVQVSFYPANRFSYKVRLRYNRESDRDPGGPSR